MKYFVFFTLLCTYNLSAQVGLGTTTPEEDLHVAGATSTIRIEGLNSVNNVNNNGENLVPVSVDGLGNYRLLPEFDEPIQFLLEEDDFIPNKPHAASSVNTGTVINSGILNTFSEGVIQTKTFNMPRPGIAQVNYAVTILLANQNLQSGNLSAITDARSRTAEIYFSVDVNNNGVLDTNEAEKKYGLKGQYYASLSGGIAGYAYMNSQGYVSLPQGMHTIYFYGVVKDGANTFTSVGFGGTKDYLKIRFYN